VSRGRRRLWLAAYALATFLAFPQRFGALFFDLGFVTAWLPPALLILGLRGLAPRAAAKHAFCAGVVAFALVFQWLYVTTVYYGDAPALVGVVVPIGLAIYPALFVASFGALWSWFGASGLASPFVAALLWVALEWARTFVLTGFPWALLGYAQHQNAALLGLAPWAGVFGMSFATVLGSAAVAALADATGDRRAAIAALAGVAVLHAAGGFERMRDEVPASRTVRAAVLQGNVDQAVKWSAEFAERTLADYEALTRRAAEQGAELVLWPETAVPGSPDYSDELADRLGALARENGVTLVVGAVGVAPHGDGALRYYDSAFTIAPDGNIVDRYDKTHLVPFGEYVPLRELLGRFVSAIARGAAATDVSPGRSPRAVAIPLPGAATLTAGVPICYELLFPNLVRRFVADGGELLLAITNDAWYGRTGAPYQFLVMTAVRSAENRVWTARAANTGVSAIIDDRGRVRMQTELFEQTLLVADLPLRSGGSFYARHGDWLPIACVAGVVGLGIAARMRRGVGR
jgi:apolipoprotein N-acyltransferase